jgi:hypothetical protein
MAYAFAFRLFQGRAYGDGMGAFLCLAGGYNPQGMMIYLDKLTARG